MSSAKPGLGRPAGTGPGNETGKESGGARSSSVNDAAGPGHADLELRIGKAIALRKAGDLEGSISEFLKLHERFPERARIAEGLIESCRAGAPLAVSLGIVQGVLKAAPDHRSALIARVDIAARRLDTDGALRFLEEALAALPADRSLRVRRCTLLRSVGQLGEAEVCLARLDAADTAVRLEGIQLDLALHRFEAAKASVRALRRAEPDDPGLAAEAVRVLQVAGALEEARRCAERAREVWPAEARIAASLIRCHLLAAGGERDAAELLEALPEDLASHPAVRSAAVVLALRVGDVAKADALVLQRGAEDRRAAALPSIAVVRGRLKVALAAGLESRFAERILGELRSAVEESAAVLAPDLRARFELETAAATGDWPRVARLTAALRESQPRDLDLVLLAARAAFESGDPAAAEGDLARVLQQNPHHPPARKLREALDLVTGRVSDYLDGRYDKLSYRNTNFVGDHLGLVSDLFTLDQPDRATACLDSCHAFVEPRSKVRASLRFWSEAARGGAADEEERDEEAEAGEAGEGETAPLAAEIAEEDVARLLDFDDQTIATGPDLREEALLAWHLCREKPESFEEWRRIAFRATNANNLISRDPRISGRIRRWLAPVDLRPLEPWLAAGDPLLLVSSHSGPRVMDRLDELIPELFYVVRTLRSLPAYDSLNGSVVRIGSRFEEVAARVFRALRQGKRAYFVADAPIGLARRGRSATAANGTLFGVPCGLVNSVPKLSRGLGIPSFWVQPVWREGRIVLEIERLPQAAPEEDDQAWCDRWAQAYLDRLGHLMSSAPENVLLNAPMWRYLLLKGKGRELPLSADGSASQGAGI